MADILSLRARLDPSHLVASFFFLLLPFPREPRRNFAPFWDVARGNSLSAARPCYTVVSSEKEVRRDGCGARVQANCDKWFVIILICIDVVSARVSRRE